jgi:hypothetical protein
MRIPFTASPDSITVFAQGKVRTILYDNKNFDKVRDALRQPEHDVEAILKMTDREQNIRDSIQGGKVVVEGGTVYYENVPVNNTLTDKLLNLLDEGFDATPWIKFLENLMQNPSYRSRECLYSFLDKFNAPITPEGKFIAFKRVRENWKDLHTNTVDNSVGVTVKMERYKVDDDPQHTCSSGLHVCADEYLKGYATGDYTRTLVVEVNPANVVAVPYDYNFSKMRVCEYTVLAEIDPKEIPDILDEEMYYLGREYESDFDEDELGYGHPEWHA